MFTFLMILLGIYVIANVILTGMAIAEDIEKGRIVGTDIIVYLAILVAGCVTELFLWIIMKCDGTVWERKEEDTHGN